MNLDTNTTVGKSAKTLIWVVVANVAVYVLTIVISRPELFNPMAVGIANVLLVAGKNFVDPAVKNI
jgi:hypothetical protein